MKQVQFRRKREGKTNYKKRLKLLLSKKPRLVIRRSNKNVYTQIVEYQSVGDKVVLSANLNELKKMGWDMGNNTASSYLTGILIGKKLIDKKIDAVVTDFFGVESVKGSKIYALLKGVKDSGFDINVDEGMFPSEDRITGKHINDNVVKKVEELKKKILGA